MFEPPPPATPGKASPRSQRTRAGFEDHAGTKDESSWVENRLFTRWRWRWRTLFCHVYHPKPLGFQMFSFFLVLEWFMPLCHKHGAQIQFRQIACWIQVYPFLLGIMIEVNSFGSLSHVQISSKFTVWWASVWTLLDTWKCIVLAKTLQPRFLDRGLTLHTF